MMVRKKLRVNLEIRLSLLFNSLIKEKILVFIRIILSYPEKRRYKKFCNIPIMAAAWPSASVVLSHPFVTPVSLRTGIRFFTARGGCILFGQTTSKIGCF